MLPFKPKIAWANLKQAHLACTAPSESTNNLCSRYLPGASGSSQLAGQLRFSQFPSEACFEFLVTERPNILEAYLVTIEIDLFD